MPIPFFSDSIKRHPNGFAFRVSHAVMMRKMRVRIMPRIAPFLQGTRILDVGLGTGTTAWFLRQCGYNVTGMDVHDLSFYPDVRPVLYDGTTMPYADNRFDTALLLHVLHHCADFKRVLQETMRVARRVILIEDTFRSSLERCIVSANDMLSNFEFSPHPYQTEEGWTRTIRALGGRIVHAASWSEAFVIGLYGRYSMFVIAKDDHDLARSS